MKKLQAIVFTASILSILVISPVYGNASATQQTDQNSTEYIMDLSANPELKKSLDIATPYIVQSVIKESPTKPTKETPIYSRVVMSGDRVVSVKTYKTKEDLEKATKQEQEHRDKLTAERKEKRKDQTRTDMLKGLTPFSNLPPVSETRELQSEMFSKPFGRQLDLRLVEAYTQDYDKTKSGDIYLYADYIDYSSKQLLGEKDGSTAISAMILRTIMRKDENKAFSIDVNVYYVDPTTQTIAISRSEDMKGIDLKKNEIAETVFKLPKHQLQAGEPQYEIAKLMYQDLTNNKINW